MIAILPLRRGLKFEGLREFGQTLVYQIGRSGSLALGEFLQPLLVSRLAPNRDDLFPLLAGGRRLGSRLVDAFFSHQRTANHLFIPLVLGRVRNPLMLLRRSLAANRHCNYMLQRTIFKNSVDTSFYRDKIELSGQVINVDRNHHWSQPMHATLRPAPSTIDDLTATLVDRVLKVQRQHLRETGRRLTYEAAFLEVMRRSEAHEPVDGDAGFSAHDLEPIACELAGRGYSPQAIDGALADIGREGTARDSGHVNPEDRDVVEELIPKATASV